MHIVVCIKQVLDPEIPARAFRVDDAGTNPVIVGVPATQVMDSYAENALELGLQLRDRTPGATLTALCMGDDSSDDVLRRAFAATANSAARAWDPSWKDFDAMATSHVLARAIAVLGGADAVLCGRQASDIEESLLGPALAEELGAPCITFVRSVDVTSGGVRAEREADGLVITVEAPLPVVMTVTSAASNVPRMPKVKDTMLAKRKPIRVLGAAELSLDVERATPGVRLVRLSLPVTGDDCEMIDGADITVQAATLVSRLRDLRLI
jgi:electron transfer flavoprotein beta subunit